MKAAESKTISNPQASTIQPFFTKTGSSSEVETSQPFFTPSAIQADLAVGAPDDPYEQEAEKVSRQVVEGFDQATSIQRKLAPFGVQPMLIQPMGLGTHISRRVQKSQEAIQAKCADCEQEEMAQPKSMGIQFSGEGASVPSDVESMIQSQRGGGSGMDEQTKSAMETSFGADFSGVRVHTGNTAVQMSQQLNAHAFTVGNDIFFNHGRYQPSTKEGAGLLSHELTHTIQQGASAQTKRINRQSLLSSLSGHTAAHLSAMNGSDSPALNRKEIAQLQQMPEEEMMKVQQLQMLQMKGVDEVQKKENVGTLRRCGRSGGGTPAVAPPATATIGEVNTPYTGVAVKRIVPRKNTSVNVTITGATAANPVILSIDGGGSGNGTVTINGAASDTLIGSGVVNLKGGDQTDPGNANKLKLVAKQGTAVLAQSNSFSVASFPLNYTDTFLSLITGPSRGFVVQDGWESDSGIVADLDKTMISEEVEYGLGKGVFLGVGRSNSGYLPGDSFTVDSHSTPVTLATGVGTIDANQTSIFKDKRTEVNDVEMKNSGYIIKREIRQIGSSAVFEITTDKHGANTTANRHYSDAGSGNIIKTQKI